jgi:hypothetical protein
MVDDPLAAALDELYTLPPAEFTAARDRHVLQAREAGDRTLAAAVSSLRKPTQAAWLANLLVRARPAEVESLLALGAALREAQQQLSGADLKRLQGERHAVVQTLVRAARQEAAAAGLPVGEQVAWDVEATLTLALADERVAAAVRTGTLVGVARRDTANPADVRTARDLAAGAAEPEPARRRSPRVRPQAERRTAGADRAQLGDDAAGASADDLARRRGERLRAALAEATEQRQAAEQALADAEAAHAEARALVDDAAHAEHVAERHRQTAVADVERLTERLAAAQVAVDAAERALAQTRAARVEADEVAARSEGDRAAAELAVRDAAGQEARARAAIDDEPGR